MDADPGVPRIIWAGPRSIRVFGYHVLMNGFRFGGHHAKAGGPVKPLENPNGQFSYDANLEGFSMPNTGEGDSEIWVAVFAMSQPGQPAANLRFVPFLQVTSYEPGTGLTRFRPSVGTMESDYFVGADALVVHERGFFSNRLVQISGNTADTITLAGGLSLDRDDYVLPSPRPGIEYKYLRTLKLDLGSAPEWRNFVFGEARTYSRTGNPFGNIRISSDEPPLKELDFRRYVSPLATGVIVIGHAYIDSGSGGEAYLSLCHDDAFNPPTRGTHYIASFGVDRTHALHMGTASNAILCFGALQSLWALTSGEAVVGTVDICGWVEG